MMATTEELLEKNWDANRLHDSSNKCPCDNCFKSSNICSHCRDWSSSIQWKIINPPNIKCTNCYNSYHLNCLPFKKRIANSWQICNEIGPEYKCSKYRDLFTFINKIENEKLSKKYESLIYEKYHKIHPNKRLKIKYHFCGFYYNNFTFIIEDCCQILLNGEPPSIARIIDIFLTKQNDAFIMIQWYHFKNKQEIINDRDKTELIFENEINLNNIDIIKIETINGRVRIVDSYQQYQSHNEKLRQLKWEKNEQIKYLKQNNKDKNIFNQLCLYQNIDVLKRGDITFDKIFWSTLSCNSYNNNNNGQNNNIYNKTKESDTNKGRMVLQEEILKTYKKRDKNVNVKRKKRVNEAKHIKHQRIMRSHDNNKAYNNGNSVDNSDDIITNYYNANRKRKRRDFDNDSSDDDYHNNNNNNKNNNNPLKRRKLFNDKNEENVVKISKTEYEEYLRLKNKSKIDDVSNSMISLKLYDEIKQENEKLKQNIIKCNQYEDEIINLQKSIQNKDIKIKQFELNERKYKEEVYSLKDTKERIYKDGKRKRAKLRDDYDKMKNNHIYECNKYKDEIKRLLATIESKNHQIEFLRKARDEQKRRDRNGSSKRNGSISYENNSNVIAVHISPVDPRINRNNNNNNNNHNNNMEMNGNINNHQNNISDQNQNQQQIQSVTMNSEKKLF